MNDVAVCCCRLETRVLCADDLKNSTCCRLEAIVSCANDLNNSSCCRLETIVSCADDLNRGVVFVSWIVGLEIAVVVACGTGLVDGTSCCCVYLLLLM